MADAAAAVAGAAAPARPHRGAVPHRTAALGEREEAGVG